jgi:hypothetical protein
LHYGRLNPSGAVKECSISYLFVEAYCLNIKDLAHSQKDTFVKCSSVLPRLTTFKFHSYEHQQLSRSFTSTEL